MPLRKDKEISVHADSVIITPDGLKVRYWIYNQTKGEGEFKTELYDPETHLIFDLLRWNCTIEEGTTLKDFCNVVKSSEDLKRFISGYSSVGFIDEWLNQLEEEPQIDMEDGAVIEKILISKFGEISEREEGNEFVTWLDLRAPGKDKDGKEESYSISGLHLARYKDLPIQLDENPVLWKIGKDHKMEKFAKLETNYSLLEVLDAFWWDISFYGPLEEAKIFFDDLKERVDKVKRGESELIPLEEVKERINKKIKEKISKKG